MCRLRIFIQIFCACAFYCVQRCSHTVFLLAFQATVPIKLELSPSVCLSLTHACFVSKRLNALSKFFHHLIGPSFQFFATKGCCVNLTASPLMEAPNTRGVAKRQEIDAYLLWKTNIKSYALIALYRIVPLSMTLSDSEPQFRVTKQFKGKYLANGAYDPVGSRLAFSGSAERN